MAWGTLALGLLAAGAARAGTAPPAMPERVERPAPPLTVRVRDLARVESVRSNQLVGYGIVFGLNGTGDTQQSPFTLQSIVSMLQRFGVTVDARRLKTKNAAAVMVTAEIPAFAKNGSRLDVTVSSIGDATSLQGGVLLQTPLLGADEAVYAVAQGSVSIGGFTAGGDSSVTKNHPTAGRVPNGALVEKEIGTTLADPEGAVRVNLASPDFQNASRIAGALNRRFGAGAAVARDAATIQVRPPAEFAKDPVGLVAEIGEVRLEPAAPAKIVLNERTGTVVIGGAVRLASVAVAHGSLTIEVQTDYDVSQPEPLARKGDTVVVPRTAVNAREPKARLMELKPGTTLADLVRALNALRVTPRDIVAIIQALKEAGGLYAELELQ